MSRPILTLLIVLPIAARAEPIDFSRQVRPILADHCWSCHGPDHNTREGDLRLDIRNEAQHVLEVSEEGGEVEFVRRTTSSDPDERMPPPSAKKQLSRQQLDILKRWIQQGARYEEHWAFVTPQKIDLPEIDDEGWSRNPIDLFVLARLQRQQLLPNQPANRRTLARRVTLDLTGLPPTPYEVDEFVNDTTSKAYERLVDRLLNSPRYGEHMAASWLDLARYADTDGYQNDRYRYMHVWRDWVIMAFNENMPYDQFLIEQLAGDMLPQATLKQQIATGFCRNHRINSEDGSIPEEWHVENIVDRVDTLGTAILGLTIGCSRCHDHKYDPVSQKEYYQLFAYFNNVSEWGIGPNNGNSPPFIEVPASWPHLSPKEALAREPAPVTLRRAREKEDGNGLKRPQAGGPKTTMVMAEMRTRRPTYLLLRGQYNAPNIAEVLSPGVPDVLHEPGLTQPSNRLELAEWLVHRSNPLTSRVAVNRLWQHFFGVGIVKTSENFGLQGEMPSHAGLLDWLAVTLIESGWDIRAIQKLIVTSSTYRQSSEVTAENGKLDPENRLLARGPRFRMHPFVLRDQALASSGLLVEQIGGPSAKPYMPPKIWRAISNNTYEQDTGTNLYRRSLYTYWRRTIPPPTMMAFNAAEREVCVARKDRTNTPLQALTMMNNVTFVETSRFLAQRMLHETHSVDSAIDLGFRLLMARAPSQQERTLLIEAYDSFLADYLAKPEDAPQLLKAGETPRDPNLPAAEHAAMTMIASLIMNLDEAMTKE